MFVMTSDIRIGEYKVKPSSVKWRTSVLSIIETCTIVLPRAAYLKNKLNTTEGYVDGAKNVIFKEGDAVSVLLGYDGNNTPRFKGFVRRINQVDNLEIECEGYQYQLPKSFSKSYASTTVRKILEDLISGTDIEIDEFTPDVPVGSARFKLASGLQVLEWMQKELHLTVYFDYNRIYAGTRYGRRKGEKKLQLGWNTASEKDLKKRKTDENVLIQVVSKNPEGKTKKTKSDEKKYSQVKELKIKYGVDPNFVKKIANDAQTKENYRGYEGSVTCFLVPEIEKSDTISVTDKRFPERSGNYFAETIEGSFDSNGGRQKVTLNFWGL
jgi:hypothetical protein